MRLEWNGNDYTLFELTGDPQRWSWAANRRISRRAYWKAWRMMM